MAEKRLTVLYLIEILTKYSDSEHYLKANEIIDHLANYGIDIERRTLYSYISLLKDKGFKINDFNDNGKGYYLEEKQFTKSEILLLCNAIHASHFISKNRSDILINKLLKTLSKYDTNEFTDNVYLPNRQKNDNDELMNNIVLISKAIKNNKQISFIYNHYDLNKKLIPKKEKHYIVEPRYIVYEDTRPYLITTRIDSLTYVHYRLDRITNINILKEEVKHIDKKDAYEYANNKLFMFSGEIINITFLCENKSIDHLLDVFGNELFIIPYDDNHYKIVVNVPKQGAKYLAYKYLDEIEIIEPKELRDEFIDELNKSIAKYKKERK